MAADHQQVQLRDYWLVIFKHISKIEYGCENHFQSG